MEFFSNSKPDLINKKTVRSMEKMLSFKNPIRELSVIDSFASFYDTYISPNIFVLILLILFCLFLAYKYIAKQTKIDEDNKEEFRPALNPTLPIKEQQSFVHYLPDDIPQTFNGKLTTVNELMPPETPIFELPNIPKPWAHREVDVGFDNLYKNANNHLIAHPYDWPNNFNSSTSSSVGYMTDKNKQSFDKLSKQISDDNDKLSQSQYQTFSNNNYCDYNSSNNVDPYHVDRPFIGF